MTLFGHTPSPRTSRPQRIAVLGACIALFVACQPKPSPSAAADTTLAHDLARVNADTASQPQLTDTVVPTAPVTPPQQPAAKARHAPAASRRPQASPAVLTQTAATAPVTAPPAAAPAPPPPPLVAASGTAFDVLVSDTVTTAKAHVGDPVTATVAADVRDASGAVVIPAGSAVHGAVTTSSGPAHTPHLAVGFTSVDVAGHSYAVESTVTTLPTVQSRRTARAAQAAEVGGGAVAGGLLGRLIGGRKSGGTVIGAVAGAAAGVVVADKTESHDAVLPRGARVTLRLTGAVTIPRG